MKNLKDIAQEFQDKTFKREFSRLATSYQKSPQELGEAVIGIVQSIVQSDNLNLVLSSTLRVVLSDYFRLYLPETGKIDWLQTRMSGEERKKVEGFFEILLRGLMYYLHNLTATLKKDPQELMSMFLENPKSLEKVLKEDYDKLDKLDVN